MSEEQNTKLGLTKLFGKKRRRSKQQLQVLFYHAKKQGKGILTTT